MRKTAGTKFGEDAADVIIQAAHLTFNAPRGKQMIEACIKRLQERLGEVKPRPATKAYKKARYGRKK